MDEEAIWTLPYAQRKLLIIWDGVLRPNESSEPDWTDHALTVADYGLRGASWLFSPLGTSLYTAGRRVYEKATREETQPLVARRVTPKQVLDIRFSPGHPQLDHAYVGHPLVPDVYYTVAEFHRRLFEHKCSEAVRLLMHLGAKVIRVERVEGWGHAFAAKISVPGTAGTFGASASAKGDSSSRLLFEARLRNTAVPCVPDDLDWFRHEPAWQAVAEARLKFGLETVNVQVEYFDDYGVNASLTAAAQGYNLDIGGLFEQCEKTKWTVSGEFA